MLKINTEDDNEIKETTYICIKDFLGLGCKINDKIKVQKKGNEFILNDECSTTPEILFEHFKKDDNWDEIKDEPKINIIKDKPENNEIVLEDEQQLIYDSVIENRQEKRIISITGAAGTGKSTTVGQIIKFLFDTNSRICVTAPTHPALKVIKSMVVQATGIDLDFDDRIIFKTVHSFLGLKLQIDNDGNESFKPSNDPNEKKIYCEYLIIDESSMVNAELSKMIFTEAFTNSRVTNQIIWTGDRYQLKPVNGEENLIFTSTNEMIHRYELKTIRRQNSDSEIIKLSQKIVELIEDNEQYNPNTFFQELMTPRKDINVYFDSAEFLNAYFEKKDETKIIGAYTNNLVNQYNEYVRYILNKDKYPEGIPYYLEGEDLIFNQPYTVQGAIAYNNGDIIRIDDVKYRNTFDKTLYYFLITDDEGTSFKILDPRYLEVFKFQLDQKANIAKNSSGRARSAAWKSFFDLKNKFANVRPVYANTFHKLQGSTYEEVFINTAEFRKVIQYDLDNALRLIYVAITRGRKLHMVIS